MALGFIKNEDEKFEFTADPRLIAKLEKYFEVSFLDEINFFEASAKAGELFEIPVAHEDAEVDRIYYYNGGYILDEITFQKGLSNKQIADILSNHDTALVIADSAEPKSIDEIAIYGISIVGAEKGKDSINHGISLVQAQRISVTKRSVNLIKEYRNYLWQTDKYGKVINEPDVVFNHCMDALRYAMVSLVKSGTSDMESERADRLLSRLRNTQPQTR